MPESHRKNIWPFLFPEEKVKDTGNELEGSKKDAEYGQTKIMIDDDNKNNTSTQNGALKAIMRDDYTNEDNRNDGKIMVD